MRTIKQHVGAVGVAALLGACNTMPDPYVSRMHASPGAVPVRSYPQYLAPWGRPAPEAVAIVPAPVVVETEIVREIPHRISALPPDMGAPLPSSRLPADNPPGLQNPLRAYEPASPAIIGGEVMASDASSNVASGKITPPARASSYAGTWKARDAENRTCNVQLSSSPALDLYKASAKGCRNTHLESVNAWSFGDNKIQLFARGNTVAYLNGSEASLTGTFAADQQRLEMTR
jgi:hypothetical protein